MVSFKSALLAVLAAAGVAAVPPVLRDETGLEPRAITPNSQGTSNGFFYQFWSDGKGTVNYQNGAAGRFTVTWSNVGDFTSGKGWKTAAARKINFAGTFTGGSNSYLAVYTWSGIGETYILEDRGSYNPGLVGTHIGTLTSDGGTYDVYHVSRSATYQQYWSIRQQPRSSGTVTTGNHYDYYNAHGLPFNLASNATYQIVSVEGYGSTGSADITVSEG